MVSLAFVVLFTAFNLFALKFVDYSIESIALAKGMTTGDPEEKSLIERHVYEGFLHDMALEEGYQLESDYSNFVLIESAINALKNPQHFASDARSKIYIEKMIKNKFERDGTYKNVRLVFYSFVRFIKKNSYQAYKYLRDSLFPKTKKGHLFSGEDLLYKAMELEKSSQFEEAKKYYYQYFETYSSQPKWGYAGLALAKILISEGEWGEAESLLTSVNFEYKGNEADLAENLINRLTIIKERISEAGRLEKDLTHFEGHPDWFLKKYRIALTYLSAHDFESAELHLGELISRPNVEYGNKAKYFLGWIYKLRNQLQKSLEIHEELLGVKEIQDSLNIAIHAGLADTYYTLGEYQSALNHYNSLIEKVSTASEETKASIKDIVDLAKVEQAVIYVQTGDSEKLKQAMKGLSGLGFSVGRISNLTKGLLDHYKMLNERDKAFIKLKQQKNKEAEFLFQNHDTLHPGDAWTQSGIATIKARERDLESAIKYAEEGYRLKPDEYTTALLAYVYTHKGSNKEAIQLYKEALDKKPGYFVAEYNLYASYLKAEEYSAAQEGYQKLFNLFKNIDDEYIKVQILNNLAIAEWYMGNRQKAIRLLGDAISLVPDYETTRSNLAMFQDVIKSHEKQRAQQKKSQDVKEQDLNNTKK